MPSFRNTALLLLAAAPVFAAAVDYAAEGKLWWSHIETLADDKMQGRNIGTAEFAKAVSYVAGRFKSIGLKKGVWANAGKDEWRTRLHEDACVFLNRPGFEAGPGCALHLHAMNTGKHFSDTKPTVCWQLPLRAVDRDEEDESVTSVLTEFGRDGWGEGGEEFAWWCTEAAEAFTAHEPVYRSMETELRLMLGDDVYGEIVKYCDARLETGPALAHPAQVKVSLGRTRIRRP